MDPQVGQKPLKYRLPPLDLGQTRQDNPEVDWGEAEPSIDMLSPPRYGEMLIMAHDPELAAATGRWYCEFFRLVAGLDPDTPPEELGVFLRSPEPKPVDYERWALMMLWMACVHLDNEYLRVVAIDSIPDGTSITHEKIFLLDKPDSDIWSDDERLVLKFIKAALNFEMTDELFQAAVESWGPKTIFRNIGLLMYYYMTAIFFEASGLDRFPGLRGDKPFVEQTMWSPKITQGRSRPSVD